MIFTATIYLAFFLASALLSLSLTHRVRRMALERGLVAEPESDRHVHTNSVPRLGGIAIFAAFSFLAVVAVTLPRSSPLALTLPVRTVASIFAGSLIIFLLGLYDDLRVAGPYLKFGIQAIAATILYFGGVGVSQFDLLAEGRALHTVVALPLTVFWVLLITNAFNLIDGLDGLAAGSAFFSTLVVFASSLFAPNPTVALLAIVLAGAILGFLRFNFHPATIFLGDSGSMFIGYVLAALALAGSQKAPTMIAVAIPVLSFGLPILDVLLAVSRRFVGGKPLFSADRDHIHHKLLKRGLSQRGAVLVLYGVTAVFALLSLVVMHDAAHIALVLTIIGLGIAVGVQYLGYPELSELQEATWTRGREAAVRGQQCGHSARDRRAPRLRRHREATRDLAEHASSGGLRWLPAWLRIRAKPRAACNSAERRKIGRRNSPRLDGDDHRQFGVGVAAGAFGEWLAGSRIPETFAHRAREALCCSTSTC